MSTPAPRGKLSPAFIIIWLASTLLLFNMMGRNNQQPNQTLAQVRELLKTQNQETRDLSIVSTRSKLDGLLRDEVKAGRMKQEEIDRELRAADILVAHTQLRAGIMRNEPARMRMAYNTLDARHRKERDTPGWASDLVSAAPDSRFPQVPSSVTGQQLYEKTSEILSESGKRELVYGMVPGGYQFIDFLVGLTGRIPSFSYWFATFLLALIVRSIVYPFTQRTIMHGRKMGQLAPLMAEIREEFKDDPAQMQRRSMALYAEYGINPVAGCLPALVQMPLFLVVYQFMLMYQFEFQKGSFLWINEATSKATNHFTGANLGEQDSILIVLYGATMLISQWLMPVSDPSQARQTRIMGVVITLMFTVFMFTGMFPVVSGFVLYWTFTNLLATAQSLRAYRIPLEPLQKVNTSTGGVIPGKGPLFPWMQGMMEAAEQRATELKNAAPPASAKPMDDSATRRTPTGGGASTGRKGPNSNPKPSSGGTGKPKQHKPKK